MILMCSDDCILGYTVTPKSRHCSTIIIGRTLLLMRKQASIQTSPMFNTQQLSIDINNCHWSAHCVRMSNDAWSLSTSKPSIISAYIFESSATNFTRLPRAANISTSLLMNIINMISPMPLPWTIPLTKLTWSDKDEQTLVMCVRSVKKLRSHCQVY